MTNTHGEMIYVNRAFERMYGYKQSEVLGKNPRILKSGYQDGGFYRKLWANLVANKRQMMEIINKTKEGKFVVIESSLTPIVDGGDKQVAYLAIQRNVTDKKRVERQLRKRTREMETLTKLMVGRELKMVELKKKLAKFEGRGGGVKEESDPV
jgi:PAS domain S-box-containing protein